MPPAPLPPKDPAYRPESNHYWRYHRLEELLACQTTVTGSLDEDLFITVHQVCELSFRQMIADLDRAIFALSPTPPDLAEATYFLTRAVRLYEVVNRAVPALTTMRAFSEFRTALGPSSGFQSFQFRRLEIMCGVRGAYWRGGTRSPQGDLHPAELESERVHGDQVRAWLRQYESSNLRARFEQLAGAAPGATHEERLQHLASDPTASRFLRALQQLDQAQLDFHRAHLKVAVQQLDQVGVQYGTGGTDFKRYLTTYEREQAPLFPGLTATPSAERR